MTNPRREFLRKTAVLTTSVLTISQSAHAQWLSDNFSPNILDGIAKSDIIDTDKIEIKLPKIAGNGTAVPITVTSRLDNIQAISILVEKNPIPLVATFRLSSQLEAFVSARLIMTETSDVIVLAETHDGLYRAKEQVKVIIGGCGT